MQTKRVEKRLDSNCTTMLRAILNKSWRQHPTKQQLYGHLPPITKTIQISRTWHAGHGWRSKDEFINDVLLWTPHTYQQRLDDQLKPIYHGSVLTRDVTLKTSRERWTIEMGGERWSGRSVLAARHDDGEECSFWNHPKSEIEII